jgi:hypothetical protein
MSMNFWAAGSALLTTLVFGGCALFFSRAGSGRRLTLVYGVLALSSLLMVFSHMVSSERERVVFSGVSFGVALVGALVLAVQLSRQ